MNSDYPNFESVFAAWCRREKLTATQVAVRLGRSYSRTLAYLKAPSDPSYSMPSLDLQKRIYLLTGGCVKPNDLAPVSLWSAELDVMDRASVPTEAVL